MSWAGLRPGNGKTVEEVLARAVQQVDCWWNAGIKEAMNQFNGAVTAPPKKGKL